MFDRQHLDSTSATWRSRSTTLRISGLAAMCALPVALADGPRSTPWSDAVPAADTDNSVQGGCPMNPATGSRCTLTRENPAKGWETPVPLGCADEGEGPNTDGGEFSPALVETEAGVWLYFSSTGSRNHDIYVSQPGNDGLFESGTPVVELNTEWDNRMPNVSKNGLEIVFSSDRADPGNQDVYTARRDRVDGPWSTPVNLGPGINTAAGETRASASWDRKRLYFGRAGAIQVSYRSKERGKP